MAERERERERVRERERETCRKTQEWRQKEGIEKGREKLGRENEQKR